LVQNYGNCFAGNMNYYSGIVREKSVLRAAIDAGIDLQRDAEDAAATAADVLERHETRLFDIGQSRKAEARPVGIVAEGVLAELQGETPPTVVATGYHELDESLAGGFSVGQLIILAARPSIGKSALALNIAEHVAEKNRHGVVYFSLEMAADELVKRLLAAKTNLDLWQIRGSHMGEASRESLTRGVKTFKDVPLYIDDTPCLRLLDLRVRSRRLVSRHKIKLIVVDYLQLIGGPRAKNETRENEVSAISRGLKAIARENSCAVLACAQLNRQAELSERPRLSHLRESGALEQDSDVVLLLHRASLDAEAAELAVAKNRNGIAGRAVPLVWRSRAVRFENAVKKSEQADFIQDVALP
jgi:replicative DNA helicase